MSSPPHEVAAVQAFRDVAVGNFRNHGLTVALETKLANWCNECRQAEPGADLTPSFNPDSATST